MEEKIDQVGKMRPDEVIAWCQQGEDYRDVLSAVVADSMFLPEGWLSVSKYSHETDFIDNQFESIREKFRLHIMSPSTNFKFWMVYEIRTKGDAIRVILVSPVYNRCLILDALENIYIKSGLLDSHRPYDIFSV
jgi:hypothetical protein